MPTLSKLKKNLPRPAHLVARFKELKPSEKRLVRAFGQGEPVEQIARKESLSLSTAGNTLIRFFCRREPPEIGALQTAVALLREGKSSFPVMQKKTEMGKDKLVEINRFYRFLSPAALLAIQKASIKTALGLSADKKSAVEELLKDPDRTIAEIVTATGVCDVTVSRISNAGKLRTTEQKTALRRKRQIEAVGALSEETRATAISLLRDRNPNTAFSTREISTMIGCSNGPLDNLNASLGPLRDAQDVQRICAQAKRRNLKPRGFFTRFCIGVGLDPSLVWSLTGAWERKTSQRTLSTKSLRQDFRIQDRQILDLSNPQIAAWFAPLPDVQLRTSDSVYYFKMTEPIRPAPYQAFLTEVLGSPLERRFTIIRTRLFNDFDFIHRFAHRIVILRNAL